MTNPNVTIRHARQAVSLVINGGIREVENFFGSDDPAKNSMITMLFDEISEEIDDWNHQEAWLTRAHLMISAMQVMLGDPECPKVVRELIAQYEMEP